MKNRRSLIIIALLLLMAGGIVLWRTRLSNPQESAAASQTKAELQSGETPKASKSEPAVSPTASSPAASATLASKREQMSSLLGGLNHKDIEFYGKVIDQAGTPVPDVLVHASVLYNNGIISGMDKAKTKSDAQGFFSISGMKGRTLGLSLEKAGYEYDGQKGPFHFTELVSEKERYTPDRNSPVLLTMWKLQGAGQMIHYNDKNWQVSPAGTPLRIDLTTGKSVSTGGDVVIEVNHPLTEPGKWLQRYPWSAVVSTPEGGLIESTSRRMYQAPESGYTKAFTYQETGEENMYMGQFDKQFYVMTRNGTYARVKLHLSTQTNPKYPTYVVASWWLNPKPGSRNLEFDPAKAITPLR